MTASKSANIVIAPYIEQLKSRHTAKAYLHDLNRLQDFLSESGATLQSITADQAAAYISSLQSSGLAPRSIRRHLSTARSFYRYLLSLDEVTQNPFADVKMPPMTSKPAIVLSQEEIENCKCVLIDEVKAILHACPDGPSSRSLRRRTFYAVRRRAIVVLFIHSDLRLSELLNLSFTSVEQVASGFQLAITGRNSRTIPLSSDCLPELIDWLRIRRDMPTPHKHLFVGYDGAPCSRMSIRQIMKWLQVRVKTNHALHPELFRRSLIHRQSGA